MARGAVLQDDRVAALGLLSRIPWWVYVAILALPGILITLPIVGLRLAGGGYYTIPSGSMRPTLPQGSAILTLPAPQSAMPQRGAIIVYDHPRNTGVDHVKRVIALPGERFRMSDGVPVINGVAVHRQSLPDHIFTPLDGSWRAGCRRATRNADVTCRAPQLQETLPDGIHHRVLDLGMIAVDNTPEVIVPVDHVLVLGDNRDNSLDSRFRQHGTVPITNIRSVAWRFHLGFPASPDDWDRLWERVE